MAASRKLKILLIKCMRVDNKHFVVTQPMGLMYLSSYLRRHGDYDIRIVDIRIGFKTAEQVAAIAREFQPDLIGYSALTIEAPCMYEALHRVKQDFPAVPAIVGGPHPSSATERCLRDGPVDLAVIGEGEETFLEIVRAFEQGRPLRGIAGTAWLEDGRVILGPPREGIEDLDGLPYPAWDLIELDEYPKLHRFSQMAIGTRYMSLFTSRACPYKCIYCHDLFGKKFRARSVESILSEIALLGQRYGIRTFEIIDDIFNFNKQRVHAFCDEVLRRGLSIHFTFPNGLRTDILDKETIDKLAAAGCRMIAFAVESANPRIQKLIRKYNRIEVIEKNIAHAADAGIFTHGYFMIGFPTETLEEMRTTIDYAIRSRLHTGSLFIANPFEGTELAALARQLGFEKDITYNSFDYYEADFNMSAVPDVDLRKLVRVATRRFYLKPARMWRILRDHPYKHMLPGQLLHYLRRSFDLYKLTQKLMPASKNPSALENAAAS